MSMKSPPPNMFLETLGGDDHKIYLLSQQGDLCNEFLNIVKESKNVEIVQHDSCLVDNNNIMPDYLVVIAEDNQFAHRSLHDSRRSLRFGTVPLILGCPTQLKEIRFPYYDALLSTPFSVFDFKNILKNMFTVRANLQKVSPQSEAFNEKAQREVNLLRFIYSRELSEISPQRDKDSPLGYSLAWVDDLLGDERGGSLLELNRLAMDGFFLKELQDRINICPQCDDYRINFRQVCPHCGSPDISTEGTIQHFACAHVAPEKNFISNDKYICPKCGKHLKHIGVDYTKPGEVVVCDHCGTVSQEANVSCLCLVCGAEFLPEQAKQISIYKYRLSQMGLEAAIQGFHSEIDFNNILKSFLNIYSLPFFEKYLQLEMQRALRYKRPFSLINLRIANLAVIDKTIGLKDKSNLIKELEKIFGTYLRNSDLISFTPEGDLYLLLIECDELRAESILQRILKRSNEVLSIPLEFKYHVTCVPNQTKDIENVQQLLSQAGLKWII
jgi:GGDEF domain-containing protein